MKKIKTLPRLVMLITAFILCIVFIFAKSITPLIFADQPSLLWKYQCIDTMKISRDSARALMHNSKTDSIITKQVSEIKNIGANCVAIDTPYDDEFLPYLQRWVSVARKYQLHVWFRGNWSGWETWFGYPKITPDQQIAKTKTFIESHASLFENNDVFTPAPEAENGWADSGLQSSDFPSFRQFLKNEYMVCNNTFLKIGKHVQCNWLSMSGGVAKEIMNKKFAEEIGNVVTLDHYVATPNDMEDFIHYFHDTYQSNFVLGEFGAPIPDLNGDMNERQQADFVNTLLLTLYKNKSLVQGVNYWALTDSSTALLNNDGSRRKVVSVLQKYFIPMHIKGTVTNTLGEPLSGVHIKTGDSVQELLTDSNGDFAITVPSSDMQLAATISGYTSITQKISSASKLVSTRMILSPSNPTIWYKVKFLLYRFFKF